MLGKLVARLIGSNVNGGQSTSTDFIDEGCRLFKEKKYDEAERFLQKALEVRPPSVIAFRLLGDLYLEQGKLDHAKRIYAKALTRDPRCAEAHWGIGMAWYYQGDLRHAYMHIKEAGRLLPQNAALLGDLGLVSMELGNLQEAREACHAAVNIDPGQLGAWNTLGVILQKFARFAKAAARFQRALSIDPNNMNALLNYGLIQNVMGNMDTAEEYIRRALEIYPDSSRAHQNMALIYKDQGRLDEACAFYLKALQLTPRSVATYTGLGKIHHMQGRYAESIAAYTKALELNPDDADAHLGLGESLLTEGNYSTGWVHYEHRLRANLSPKRFFPFPEWDGTSFSGKNVLVYTEQGLGDSIMFSSCLPDLIRDANFCVVACEPRLKDIFARSFPGAGVHSIREHRFDSYPPASSSFDYCCPIGSLPLAYRNTLHDFPMHSGYLKADQERVRYWKGRLDSLGSGKKIGISWVGGLTHTGKAVRSLALNDFLPILRLPDLHFVSLQYTDCQQELDEVFEKDSITIKHWEEAINDYDETAALVCALDLVITVCTSIVHLTGALGKPVWVLAPAHPAWRYGREGEVMPWYPSSRLFRQTQPGEWGPVIESITSELQRFAHE